MKRILIFTMLYFSTSGRTLRKRQIFREQVLPHMGGKVPDAAFQTERLALNQLNARGIYSANGVYLEHHSDTDLKSSRNVKTMQAPKDDRYVAPEGRYHYRMPPTLDTTYVIREPVQLPITPNLRYQPLPLLPIASLKLAGYYRSMRQHGAQPQNPQHLQHADGQRNDIEDVGDFAAQAKKEYEPYLKKLHELDK